MRTTLFWLRSRESWGAWLVLGLALVLSALLAGHVPGVNGPEYWRWPWQSLPTPDVALALLPGVVSFAVAQWTAARWPDRPSVSVSFLMVSTVALELGCLGVLSRPFSLSLLADYVQSPDITGYFAQARTVDDVPSFLASFPELIPSFPVHAHNKPPGQILYYVALCRLVGDAHRAALLGGLGIAAAASLNAPAVHLLGGAIGHERDARFAAASLMALCPAVAVLLPEFDQVYPAVVAALVATHVMALERGSWRASVSFGAVLTLVTVLSYTMLVTGLLLAAYTALFLRPAPLQRLSRVVKHVGIAVGLCVACYVALYLSVKFRPLDAFVAAFREERFRSQDLMHDWPRTVPWDLSDWSVGTGSVAVALLGISAFRAARAKGEAGSSFALLATGQILAVAIFQLLPRETFRTWMFFTPLAVVVAGEELARWPRPVRLATYAALVLVLFSVRQNMRFIWS